MKNKYNWDLTKLYKNEESFNEDIKKVEKNIINIEKIEKNYINFLDILKIQENTYRVFSKLASYAYMKLDEDSRVSESQKRKLKIGSLNTKLEETFSFVSPLIFSFTNEEIDIIFNDIKYEKYKLLIEKELRYKNHTLSSKEEKILGSFSEVEDASHNTFYMLSYADLKFPEIESNNNEKLTHANFIEMLTNKNKDIRKEAFEKYYSIYNDFSNTFATTLYNNMKSLSVNAKIRKYNSSIEKELYSDDIPVELYNTLIHTVNENLPYLQKYYEIKKRYLELEEMNMYDVYLPLTKKSSKKYSFEEAKNIVLNAVKPLGKEYGEIMKKAFNENWIDVYPKEGKRSGAYSGGCYDSNPYILLNYTGNLDSIFTLIHELGHSIHSYYSRKNNDFLYSSYTIFVAEVASTTNEQLLLKYMLENTNDDEEIIILLDHLIDSFKATIFRQTMFAEFEKITHEKIDNNEPLNSQDFKDIYYKLNKKYFGNSVVSNEEIAIEWARIPHFYNDFYVYKYATGLASAVILSENIKNGGENVRKYIDFLKDGSKNFPLVQLKNAGADINNSENLNIAFKVFKEAVEKLDNIVK